MMNSYSPDGGCVNVYDNSISVYDVSNFEVVDPSIISAMIESCERFIHYASIRKEQLKRNERRKYLED